jgi:hypothetical protein
MSDELRPAFAGGGKDRCDLASPDAVSRVLDRIFHGGAGDPRAASGLALSLVAAVLDRLGYGRAANVFEDHFTCSIRAEGERMSDGDGYGQGFLAGAGTATVPPVDWTAQELAVLGEVVRDSLRKTARRGVDAYVRGGVGRETAARRLAELLDDVSKECASKGAW